MPSWKNYQKKSNQSLEIISNKINYQNIRNSAWIFLLANKVNRLPIDLKEIAEKNGWELFVYEHHKKLAHILEEKFPDLCDGWTSLYKDKVFIFFKGSRHEGRNRFTIAHEFGHLALHHIKELKREEFEQEANMFAARILMPLCLLKECHVQTAEEIASLCRTSIESAQYRAERLKAVSTRNMFYKSPLERKVAIQFKNYIIEFNKRLFPIPPFYKSLKKIRLARGLTQTQMAERLNISQQEYQRFENNESEPNISLLIEIADVFNVSIDYLLGHKVAGDNIEVLFNKLSSTQQRRTLDFINGIITDID